MSREADYTIKGFLYQFNKTLEEILSSESGEEITVEGIIEDIDVVSDAETCAIQCKYHETKQYKLSDVYKPILQMMVHFAAHRDKKIKYILYAHFADRASINIALNADDFNKIISTNDISYLTKYVSKLLPPDEGSEIEQILLKKRRTTEDKNKIKKYYLDADLDKLSSLVEEFNNSETFEFIAGPKFDALIAAVKSKMCKVCGFSEDDVEDLFYPNAIQSIADISINHDCNQRVVEKEGFIDVLSKAKRTAITRWTKELSSYTSLLSKRRGQLKKSLGQNDRLRYLIFKPDDFENFDSEIVNFISDYVKIYNSKIKLHLQTPLIAFDSHDGVSDFNKIVVRMYKKGITCETGVKGDEFFPELFLEEPMRTDNWVAFKLRLCVLNDETIRAINSKKCEDLYLIGKVDQTALDLQDVNVERLEVTNFQELRYLLHMNSSL
ncbi:hypothetical protein [Maridesulfovibrio sp.]|uniref:hypothetical protein n=1 Tax=Maridesulfovibrio sp. TaxID=2795000 RepID=UPI0039EEA551